MHGPLDEQASGVALGIVMVYGWGKVQKSMPAAMHGDTMLLYFLLHVDINDRWTTRTGGTKYNFLVQF